MGNPRRKTNTTPIWTWCIIGVVGIIAILGLIFGASAFRDLRQMNNQEPSKWGIKDDNLVTNKNSVMINTKSRSRGNEHHLETEEVTGGLFFGDQETLRKEAGIVLSSSDQNVPSLSLELYENATVDANQYYNKAGFPPCDRSPPVKIRVKKDQCPRFFVGINNKNPQCHLDVNETMCVEGETLLRGNVTIDGILFVNNIVGTNITAVQCNNNDADCDDLNNCTIDKCNSNFCEYLLVNSCAHSSDCTGNGVCGSNCTCMEFIKPECTINIECDDLNPCTDDSCFNGICRHEPVLRCCVIDSDCEDFNSCTLNKCNNNTCEHPLINECAHSNDCPDNTVCGSFCNCTEFLTPECELNSECNDSDSCTEDLCIRNICNNERIPRCCIEDNDCLDFNDCTIDNCINGLCRNEQIPSCCRFDETCDDFNDCTVDSCGEEGLCNFTLIRECAHSSDCPGNGVCGSNCTCMEFIKPQCAVDSNCEDFNSCTSDTCVGGICKNEVEEGTCNQDHLCDSNEFCNTTTCLCELSCNQSQCNTFPCEVHTCIDGECVFLHKDVDCCTSNADCDDGNACAPKFCNLITGQCMPMSSIGCRFDSDCISGQVCDSNCTCVDLCPLTVCNFTDFGNQFELPSNPLDNDFFMAGFSVSVHNDRMIVGAPGDEIRGAAIILSRHADNIWIEEAFLVFGLNITGKLGTEVKIYNDIAIVLCPLCIFSVRVLIFEFSVNWTQVGALFALSFDEYNIDLLDEKILFTVSNTTSGTSTIFIHDRNQTTGVWDVTQKIDLGGIITDSAFDKSDSDYFVVGVKDGAFADGDVFLFLFNGTQYNNIRVISTDVGIPGDELKFGTSVDFHNGVVVVGSPSPNTTEFNERVFLYSVSGSSIFFLQFVRPRHLNAASFTECGTSVAIHNDTIVVGCINERVNDDNIGAANVFKLIGDEYRWIARITAPAIENLFPSSFYGHSVDIDGKTIVIGAPRSDITHSADGNVYINRCTELQVCQ